MLKYGNAFMNIDLLITPEGEAGLLCSENLVKKSVGILLDEKNGTVFIEFQDMDNLELNIPIEQELIYTLDNCPLIHIGAVVQGKVSQAYQVPLMFLNDPYRGEAFCNVRIPQKSLAAFECFIKKCVLGQPVHRDDAGDEESSGCILGEALPSSLEFAPHLARRHTMEVAPSAAPQIRGPGMGMGGSSGGGGRTYHSQTRHGTDDED